MNIHTQILSLASLAIFATLAPIQAGELPKTYPLTTCVVSGEKLGEHGKVVKVTSDGTDVYLCCNMCKKDFAQDPAKYVKIVKDASNKK